MRAHIIALAAVLAATVPAVALAQSAAERDLQNQLRMQQVQQNLQQYNSQQIPNSQAEQRLNDLDQRVRTQQNLEAVSPPLGPVYRPMDTTSPSLTAGIDLSAQSALMAKELAAENARLRNYNNP